MPQGQFIICSMREDGLCLLLLMILPHGCPGLSIDATVSGTSVRYDTSLLAWKVAVPGSFEADCIIPQLSLTPHVRQDYSVFESCEQLTQQIFHSPFTPPDKFGTNASCFEFLKELQSNSFVESQTLCGDPYTDNSLVWQHEAMLLNYKSPQIFALFHNISHARIDFRVLYIKRLTIHFAVHLKTFNFVLERPSQLKSVTHAYTISQNLCIFLGLPNIDHGLLFSYEYHEHLTSCNVRCGKSFVRRPWLRSSMPLFSFDNVSSTVTNYSQHAHVLQRQVTCEPVVPPFNAVVSSMPIVVPQQYSVPYTLTDDFFENINSLALDIEDWFSTQNLTVTAVINIENTRYDDVKFTSVINAMLSEINTDDFQIIVNSQQPTSRRLLTNFDELDVKLMMVISESETSPAHLDFLIHKMENEVLSQKTSSYVSSIEPIKIETMYHVPFVPDPQKDSTFSIPMLVVMGLLTISVIVGLVYIMCVKRPSSQNYKE